MLFVSKNAIKELEVTGKVPYTGWGLGSMSCFPEKCVTKGVMFSRVTAFFGYVYKSKMLFAIVLPLMFAGVLAGCGQQEAVKSPDLRYYDNGYGTYFVCGTRIEHPADQSTSILVDWSREPQAKVPEEVQFREEKHIVYQHSTHTDGHEEGEPLDLRLNLMLPEAADNNSLQPVIVLAPGGGFISCRIDGKYTEVQRYLVQHGYAVAIMEYHIIGQGRYMDAAEDVRACIDWVKEHGAEYRLDPSRIALMGNSAGGYVAALAACRDETDIRCVVNFYGLSDLINNKADYEDAAIEAQHKPESSDSQFVNGALSGLGLTDAPEEADKADPSRYIDGNEPPFLHLHGDADLWVSPSQSVHLHDALTAAGVESTRYCAKGAGHGDKAFRTKAALDIVLEFLDTWCGSGGLR